MKETESDKLKRIANVNGWNISENTYRIINESQSFEDAIKFLTQERDEITEMIQYIKESF